MKNAHLFIALLLPFFVVQTSLAQQIVVGSFVGGNPTLDLTDAELTDTLAFTLNGLTLSNCTIESATDTLGLFYYIKATGSRTTQTADSKVAVILSVDGNDILFDAATGCTMECRPSLPCTGCGQTILEKCKRQICSCTSSSGGCGSVVNFTE